MNSIFDFPGKRDGEEVLEVVKKHTIVFIKIIMAFFLIVLLPLIVFLLFWFTAYPLSNYYDRGIVVGIFSCIFILYGLLFTCIRWLNEEFDVFIITTDRLIDVTQISFLKRSVASTPLEQIQDTTGLVSGFIPTILKYGDLTVQTAAGNASELFIDRIPDPESISRKILDWAHQKREDRTLGR